MYTVPLTIMYTNVYVARLCYLTCKKFMGMYYVYYITYYYYVFTTLVIKAIITSKLADPIRNSMTKMNLIRKHNYLKIFFNDRMKIYIKTIYFLDLWKITII